MKRKMRMHEIYYISDTLFCIERFYIHLQTKFTCIWSKKKFKVKKLIN